MIKQTDRLLVAELEKAGILSEAAATKCLKEIETSTESTRSCLLRQGMVTEEQLLAAMSSAFKIPTCRLRDVTIDKAVIERIPVRFVWYYKFMPLKIEGKKIFLAGSAPLDVKFQDELRVHLGLDPYIMLAKESDILDAINKYYGLAADTLERLTREAAAKEPGEEQASQWVEDLEKETDEATVARLVNQILLEAYKKRATDIHIEPYRRLVRIRYRIDGVLVDANVPPAVRSFLPSIISRIKIMANLSIVEKRLPQDGSAVVKTKEQDLDLRISTIPTPYGESMVIRILPSHVMLMSLEKLGLDPANLRIFRALVNKPHGIILVTGPTGSGKTTTLYACLNEINSPTRKIITLEDPLEYETEGITQIQVNPKVHLDFATGLRSVLRHDPDIIMVGEVRDLETAEIAIRTALTGHLVFSTLHTNDAASGVTRLIEMGLEPYLVASSLEAFVAQRLVRIICPKCKEEDHDPLPDIRAEIAQSLGLGDTRQAKIYRGRGCDYCNRTGYFGRTAIYEILVMDTDIRSAILEKKRADDIKRLAMRHGMLTLRQNGWQKVVAGMTTPSEVLNVTVKDEGLLGERQKDEGKTGRDPDGFSREVNQEILGAKNEYELRVYPRASLAVGIRYAIARQDHADPAKLIIERVDHSSVTRDLSAGGLRFISGYALPVNTLLSLRIQLDKAEKSIDCLAKVCRVEEDALATMFNVVVYYLDISSADRVRISQFVAKSVPGAGKEVAGEGH